MRLPVIICSHNRPRHLKQTLDSLKQNSSVKLQVIVVDDSDKGFYDEIKEFITDETFYHFKSPSTIGQSKLKGASLARKSEYIYFSDDDVYFLKGWDKTSMEALRLYDDLCIVGARGVHGASEPRPVGEATVCYQRLQTGYSMMFRREEWDKYGHFPNYDEDSWISYEMMSRTGKKIGVIDPPLIIHCGLTSLNTAKAFDYDNILLSKKQYPDLIYE